jgi:hypothetical protein
MKYSKRTRYHEQYPARGFWGPSTATINPSYLTIGGSGVVGNFGAESPMSEKGESSMSEVGETAAQESAEGASMNSGSGAAAGAAPTAGGSGVA